VKTKTAYRIKPEIPADNIPVENKPAEEIPAVAVDVQQPEPQAGSSHPDDAGAALQKQVDELRRSEELQRQAAEHAARM
jgi:hypothetical protein